MLSGMTWLFAKARENFLEPMIPPRATWWLAGVSFFLIGLPISAADWPQFLGPDRNGVSKETNLAAVWPVEGPKRMWGMKIGVGWSGPVVSSHRLILFHRVNNQEVVECLNATNGTRLWRAASPATYRDDFGFEDGPRATPSIDEGRVFTFGADGLLNCWDLNTGTNLWGVDTRKQFGNDKGFFGIACSPLVEGDAVILNLGGNKGAGIVAFDKSNGKMRWKATDQEASYSSPVAATIGGKRRVFVFARKGLVALETDGKVLWEFPWAPRIQASVSAAVPLIIEDQVFLSASYGAGAALLRFGISGPEVLWSGDDILSNHYATSVQHRGLLFGFDGRQEQRCNLRCVDLKSGKILWSEDRFGAGTLMVVGGRLLILTERGELILAKASPDKFLPLARAQILGTDIRAHPALANGLFHARDKGTLGCFDLRPSR